MQYEIKGGELPVVICTLERGETVMTQSGGMAWMSPNMKMETRMGGVGKAISRKFMNESAFLNYYSPQGGQGLIAFASSFPGQIQAFDIAPGREIVMQKRAFLAGQDGIDLSVFFQKRLGTAIWGGEGFIMQKVSGRGMVFAELDGSVTEYELGSNDRIVMDTGFLAAMSATCSIDIVPIPGMKNLLFGGEGLFNTTVTGPGHVWVQSIPINRLAGTLSQFLTVRRE